MTKQIFLYLLLSSFLMLLLGVVYSYSLFRLEIESLYGVNQLKSGIPYMITLFFYALFMFIGGFLYSQYKTQIIAFIGMALIVSGFFLASLSNSILLISLTYGVLLGSGIGLLYGLPLRVIIQFSYKNKGLLTGIILVGFGLSPLMFAGVIQYFLNQLGLHQTFFYLAILFSILLGPIIFFLSRKDKICKEKKSMSYSVLKKKAFYIVYSLFLIGTLIGLTFIGFTGNVADELIGLSHTKIALLIGLFAVFNGVGRPFFGYLNDIISFKKTAILSFTSIIIVSFLLYVFSTNYIIFILAFIVFYINFGGWLALAPAATLLLSKEEEYSKNYGLMFTAYGLGALVGPLISGYISSNFELRSIFIFSIVAAFLGLLIVFTQGKNIHK